MDPNNTPTPGSVADIQARLLLWCRRAGPGLARVEFTDERVRQRIVHGLRAELGSNGVLFNEITLPVDKEPTALVRDLLHRLERLPAGVVSVDGFPAALPASPNDLAGALYAFNFNRENLARPPQRQIWWMPPHFAEAFLRAVPDLDSWFVVKLRLTEIPPLVSEPAPYEIRTRESFATPISPEDARRQAGDLMERLKRGLAEGLSAQELYDHLILPGSRVLRKAGLEKEAISLVESARQTSGSATTSVARPSDDRDAALAEAVILRRRADKLHESLNFKEAEDIYHEALPRCENLVGPDHPEVATVLNNLAHLLKATNRLAEAEPLMRRALAIDERSFGPDHPEVATDLNNLATLLQATNRLAEAEPLMRRALVIDEVSYGSDHPNVAIRLNNLAQLLQASNRLAEAEPLMRLALAIVERSYGPDHPKVAIRLNNLAGLLQDTNRLAEAEPLMRRGLTIVERSKGADHPNVAIHLNNLATLLQATNRLAEAEPLMRRALVIDEVSYGSDHPNVAIRLNNLAQLLQASNRLAEAEPLMRRALEIDERSFGSDHPDVARCLNNLAQLLQATNRPAEAKPLLRRALAILERSLGPGHPNTETVRDNLQPLSPSAQTRQ